VAVIFYLSENNLRCRLAERLDALGAQGLLDQAALFHHGNLLQIRLELAVGCTQGERAAVSEGGCLAAGVAFSHLINPFRTMMPMGQLPFTKAGHFTIQSTHLQVK
jgi:hypothetical protein